MISTFGIDPSTGRPSMPAMSATAVAKLAELGVKERPRPAAGLLSNEKGGANDLIHGGWALVFPGPSICDPAVVAARRGNLTGLSRRRHQEAAGNVVELTYERGETALEFSDRAKQEIRALRRNELRALPAYLVLVGTPEEIPWQVEHDLWAEHFVGRLPLSPRELEIYASSVLSQEASAEDDRVDGIALWGPRHDFDPPTQLSHDSLLAPLAKSAENLAFELTGRCADMRGERATAQGLSEWLRSGRERVLITASHGIDVARRDPSQAARLQGALVGHGWFRPSASIARDHFFAAEDVGVDANVKGLVAFLFGCFTAGCPAEESLSPLLRVRQLAPRPFAAALGKALLTHSRGSALGVFGHIDRALEVSIQTRSGGEDIAPFHQVPWRCLNQWRLGPCLSGFVSRAHLASNDLLQVVRGGVPRSRADLAALWCRRSDAHNYVLLGDPAVRIP